LIILSVFLIAFFGQLILYWLILNRHLFSDQNESFLIEKGLFYRKKIDIPYDNIHSIAIKRSLLSIILGLSTLQLDTGSTATSAIPEASITVDKKYAPVIKDFIEKRKTQEGLSLPSPNNYSENIVLEDNTYYQAKWYELMYMGILKPGFLTFILFLTIIIWGYVPILNQIDAELNEQAIILPLIITYFILIAVGAISFMLFTFLKYYKYQLIIEEKTITYKYGLFNKIEFKLHKNRINAYHVSQSLLYRIFNFYDLTISVIGIGQTTEDGNMKMESKSLLPITKLDFLDDTLENVGFLQENSLPYKPNKFKYLNFIFLPMVVITFINLLPYVLLKVKLMDNLLSILVNVIIYLIIFWGLSLRLKNHIMYIAKDSLSFQRGAFTIKKSYIKKVKIQKVAFKKNPILQLEKIGHIEIRYKELLGNVRMRNFDPDVFDLLRESIVN